MKTEYIKKLQKGVNLYIFLSMALVLLLSIFTMFYHEHHFTIILLISIFFILLLVLRKINNYQKNVEFKYEQKLSELKDAKTMYHDLFDITPNIMATTNGLNIVNANRAMLDFFGYDSLEDFLNEHECICDFFEEENECLGKEVDDMNWFEYVEKNPDKIHKVSMSKDGNKHIFVVKSKKLHDTDNTYLIVFSDITDIELSRERYTFALNATNDGLWDLNLLNNELYLSDNWKRQLGYESYELKSSQDIWGDLIHPDDKINSRQDFTNNIYGNTEFYESIYRLKHKDGHWVWILDRGKTLYDSDGRAIRMIGTHTDISEIKELEKNLKRQKHLFELFMKNIPAYVSIKDSNTKLTYANPLTKQLLNDMNIKGKELEDYLDEESVKKIKYLDEKTCENGKCEDIISISIPNDGDKHYRVIKFIIKNGDNKKQVATLAFDITKDYENRQKLTNQQDIMIAQSRHAALGEMISMIAHQWRQPISIIAMEANNMLVDIALDSLDNNISELYANNILYQTKELSNTIDDFRNFFKPVKIREEVKLKDLFDDVTSIIGKSFENNNIKLDLEIDNTIELSTFTRELMQVIINILKNSKESLMEHNKENPTVKVLTQEKDNMLNIEIYDNGPGIDEEIMDKIFEPYFSTKDKNGTGLGLYMSKIIIEEHLDGTLHTENVENGVCFYITIPYSP